ncbi:hypothetical protein RI129_010079 [Pyrocoelia pectoralis]|uniref:Uncharacterized protein n=1 Tax=Pyrocoelia pectoralis TaxID=417401 RepID=A0AAN7V600_9COLE
MNEKKPLRFLQLFTKEELRDLYEDSAFNPASQVIVKKPNGLKTKHSIPAAKRSMCVQRNSYKPPEQNRYTGNIPQLKESQEKMARKKLFTSNSREIVRQPFKVKCVSKSRSRNSRFNNSSPLIDISAVENQLSSHLEFKKPTGHRENQKRTPSNIKSSINTNGNELENTNTMASSGEKEFIELEERCDVKNTKRQNKIKNKSKIYKILLSDCENFACIKTKFEQFQIEFERFSVKHEQNVKEIERLLSIDRNTTSKQVTFANDETEDKGLEKAITMYNSIRKNCNTILRTPKGDRSCLETPQSLKRIKDSLSIKLEKQCLLLQDTPSK